MENITEVTSALIEGKVRVYDESPGYCLRVTREIVQLGTGISYDQFYGVIKERVEENTGDSYWARDLQRALRNMGLQVAKNDVAAGDLVFSHKYAYPIGHVAVVHSMLPDGGVMLVENTKSTRGVQLTGYNRLTRLNLWDYQSSIEVMKLPLEWTNVAQ